ncbi:hypothetical protein GTQ34_12315 [Muricauda sp. JGD-17]|uniref:Signal transduction histidine kinase internal region domain-containing protein n=1 Tax=Flagellimonas ochracea TaxID=2696472 RepID=A0A964TFE3_9FLAO|nr:histidine kinase [Allomuricauda ochracea]NAY92701.1 hypothetical protein [Allomuricauda ochracea]
MKKEWSRVARHLLFWAIFVMLWSTHDLNYHRDLLDNFRTNLVAFVPYAVLVYFNLYFLAPKFLLNKKIAHYLIFLILCIILATWFSSHYLHYYFSRINVYLPTANFFHSFEGRIAIATEVILSLCLSMTLFLIDQWYKKEQVLREIEQKHLETELSLLKSQINPHFLFNSLNSIYVMMNRNLNAGKKMLLEFSELLSYQLYETGKKHISLEREFENLANYINIESVRHSDLVTVIHNFPKNLGELHISPMLLLPIVENAFKHGQNSRGYEIQVQADISSDSVLNFNVQNTSANRTKTRVKHKDQKGIGITNLKRRLELIYSNRHVLTIKDMEERFIVNLKIELDETKMLNR